MVFSRNYDKSLWLMIYGDMLNRDKIALVIKNISFELLAEIQELITQYDIDNKIKNINYVRDDSRYEISIDRTGLSIKIIKLNEGLTEEIELFLMTYDDEYIAQMEIKDAFSLGSLTNTTYYGCMKFGTKLNEYEMVKTFVGSYVKLYMDNSVKSLGRKRVNIKRIPDCFNAMNFRSDKGIKRLVREMK